MVAKTSGVPFSYLGLLYGTDLLCETLRTLGATGSYRFAFGSRNELQHCKKLWDDVLYERHRRQTHRAKRTVHNLRTVLYIAGNLGCEPYFQHQ